MREERLVVTCDGKRIRGVLHLPDHDQSPCVVISHGLFSDKGTVKFQEMAEEFPGAGFAVLRFDFMGCGESEGRVEETTISGRLANLEMMFALARSHPLINREGIGLMGSSMGGYISLLKAARDERVKALVVWATPFILDELKEKIQTGEEPALEPSFYAELDRYTLGSLLGKVRNCLVIHGDTDELVPDSHARQIYYRLGRPRGMRIVRDADHRFSDHGHRFQARELTLDWFRRFLTPGDH